MSDSQSKKPEITFTKTTPYRVSGLENFYDSNGEKLPTKSVLVLCRCGESKKKPLCDGSHNAKGIDGEKKKGRLKDKVHHFKGQEITINDNRCVCSHDRSCVKHSPSVFRKGRRPWVDPNGASAEEIIDTIKKCPSGALSYTIDNITYTELDREPAIKVAKNGPLEITGGIELKDDMNSKPQSAEHYTLCRCGGSKNHPFCDGSHRKNDFNDKS